MRRCASSRSLAVEQRHVEPKARHVPTLADGQGEQCEKQRRERGVVPFGDVLQRAAFLCIQLYGQAIAAAAVRRAQQARRRWHLHQALTPPTLTAFAPLAQRLVGVTLCEVIEVGRRRVMGGTGGHR